MKVFCQFISRYQNFVLVDSKPGECRDGSCGLVLACSLPVPTLVRLKFAACMYVCMYVCVGGGWMDAVGRNSGPCTATFNDLFRSPF
jgi:hypothetical protein